ncbi:MAG: ATP cone domain-containing protein [bacterium]|nr:ATP cone domain-containing protein [bacterium]
MNTINVIKSNGQSQPFDALKIRRTILRSGANEETANRIANEVEKNVRDGMKTREIYDMIIALLEQKAPAVSRRYDLRKSILRLGPAGFDFEKYIAELLAAYSYKTELPPILQGACVTHEVDVLAAKEGRTAMIEAKLRQELGIFITIKDTMSTWARFLDLVDSSKIGKAPHLDECWLVTNSRFSTDSIKFGHCKNMVMLSWDHPRERPLPIWIDDVSLYPVTILKSIGPSILKSFSEANILLLRDLVKISPEELQKSLKLPPNVIEKLIEEAKMILTKE